MPEIGTSGSMSGDEKRSDATWPQRPRSSSTLPKRCGRQAIRSVATDSERRLRSARISWQSDKVFRRLLVARVHRINLAGCQRKPGKRMRRRRSVTPVQEFSRRSKPPGRYFMMMGRLPDLLHGLHRILKLLIWSAQLGAARRRPVPPHLPLVRQALSPP